VSQVDVRQRLRRGEPVSLEDRAVLVTGADGGIGRATVAGLIDHGCAVWAATRSESGSRALLDEYGSRIRPLVFDLTDDAATAAAAEQVTAAGPLYGVANIAGAALPGPLEQLPIDRFRRQLEINVTGQLKLTQALLPALRAGVATWGDAKIVIMGSLDARIVGPLFGPYAASKHALVGLADALRAELRPARIAVVLLEPGAVATPIWRRGVSSLADLQDDLPDRGGPYRAVIDFARRHVPKLEILGSDPRFTAAAVARSLADPSPAPRQAVGIDAKIVSGLLELLPQRAIYRLAALPAVWSARSRRRGEQREQDR